MHKIYSGFFIFIILCFMYVSIMDYYEIRYQELIQSKITNFLHFSQNIYNSTVYNEKTMIENTPVYNEVKNISDCPEIPPDLVGRKNVTLSPIPKLDDLKSELSWVDLGGHHSPECRTNQSTAIIIPFRNREDQLLLFLKNMHPFLRRQQLNYTIFVVEQIDNLPFNRGELMNIGYTEAMKIHNFTCFLFHDVDLFPEDDRNLYRCTENPKHMITGMNKWKYKLSYKLYVGGVFAIDSEKYRMVNGFSNRFWGWGGEDDDFQERLTNQSIQWIRANQDIGLYSMVSHSPEKPNPERYTLLKNNSQYFSTDGLVNINYTVVVTKKDLLYTKISVELFR